MKFITPFKVAMGLSLLAHGIGLSAYYAYRHQQEGAKLEFNQDRVIELVVLSEPTQMPKPAAAVIVSKVISKPAAAQPLPEVKPVLVQAPNPITMPVPEVATVVREDPIPQIQEIPESSNSSELANSDVSTKAQIQSVTADAGSPANYLFNPRPLYPAESRRRKEEGLVLLAVLVDEEGLPENVQVTQGSGHLLLDKAAVKAVSRWRFSPARLGNQCVTSQIQVPIRFKLSVPK